MPPGMGGMPPGMRRGGPPGGGPGGPPRGEMYKKGSSVLKLTAKTFAKRVGKRHRGSRVWLVKFYSPTCPHCHSMVGAMEELAEGLRGAARVAAVDCQAQAQLCQSYGVRGYPTIKLLGPDGSRDYEGPRTAKAMRDALVALVPGDSVRVVSGSKFRSLQSLRSRFCDGEDGAGRPKVCVLLLSQKSRPSPLFRAIAAQHRDEQTTVADEDGAAFVFIHVDIGRGDKHRNEAARALGLTGTDAKPDASLVMLRGKAAVSHDRSYVSFGTVSNWLKLDGPKLVLRARN